MRAVALRKQGVFFAQQVVEDRLVRAAAAIGAGRVADVKDIVRGFALLWADLPNLLRRSARA